MKIGSNASGPFTADEILTVAGLHMLNPSAEIIRTQDEELLATCKIYYQTKWTSTSASWQIVVISFVDFWEQNHLRLCGDQIIALRVDRVLRPFDASSNKKLASALVATIEALNPHWREKRSSEDAFSEALQLAKRLLERLIDQAKSDEQVQTYVRSMRPKDPGSHILVLDEACPWERLESVQTPNIHFVVMKSAGEGWEVHGAKCGSHNGRHDPRIGGNRYQILIWPNPEVPRSSTGLLEAMVDGATISLHKDRFMAHVSTKEGAIAFALRAVKG